MMWSLHWSCSGNHIVESSWVCFLCHFCGHVLPTGVLVLFPSSLPRFSVSLWYGGFHWDTAAVVELSTVTYSLHFNWFNIIVIVSNCCQRTSFGDDWQPHLSANFTIHFLTSSVKGRMSYLPRALSVKRFSRVPRRLIFLFILTVCEALQADLPCVLQRTQNTAQPRSPGNACLLSPTRCLNLTRLCQQKFPGCIFKH